MTEMGEVLDHFQLAPLLLHYAGNLTAVSSLFAHSPVNRDNHPVIEYEAPRTHRRARAKLTSWLTGSELIALFDQLQGAVTPENDPFLGQLSARESRLARAGLSLHRARVLDREDDAEGRQAALAEFRGFLEAPGAQPAEEFHVQFKREIEGLIKKYEGRISALRDRLQEDEAESSRYLQGPEPDAQ
jgi:hypothetical protein